jgi:hypothetical protein
VALCQARISTKPLWGFSSSNPYHSQSRAEQVCLLKSKTYLSKLFQGTEIKMLNLRYRENFKKVSQGLFINVSDVNKIVFTRCTVSFRELAQSFVKNL